MAVKSKSQTSLEERLIDSADLEEALEEREKRNNSAKELRRQFREADERAKGLLAEHELQDGDTVRCGRFLITKAPVPGRTVSFETTPSSRVRIDTAEAEG
jgi:hypothetical protein